MQIELPEEIVKFMQNLAAEMKAQDNRITRSPYYYVVMGQRETAAPAGFGDVIYYVREWGESFTPDELRERLAEMKKQIEDECYDDRDDAVTDFDEFISSEECEEYSAAYVDVEDNVFFTFKGYEQHMKLNGHNYRHLKDVRSYVKYAGRNPEMDMLHKAIMAFAVAEVQP